MNSKPAYVRPLVTAGAHPMETGRYVIATPPVCRLYEDVRTWVVNRAHGGMVFGKQRFGKTRAVRYVLAQLAHDFGKSLPVFSINCRDYRLPTENTFFEDLLRSVGHAFLSGKASVKRDRMAEFLHERAQGEGGKNRLVVILDEAQKLQEMHFRWLVDLHNELDARGVTTTWILVGQEELVHQREVFVTSKRMQIVGRFMVHQHRFTGLHSVEDFRFCLESYDDAARTEYPIGSGWSFTQFFFPAAFASGWRLATEAETLWQAFHKVRVETRLPADAEVPMQYFAGTIEYALRTFSATADTLNLSLNMWREAIRSSGYHDAAQYV